MPHGDRTGPEGYGPMTGRAMGFCAGYDAPGYVRGGVGWVQGRGPMRYAGAGGGGGRHGWRNCFYATGLPGWARSGVPYSYFGTGGFTPPFGARPPASEDELRFLRQQADSLQARLDIVQSRIDELEAKREQESDDSNGKS